MSRILIIDDEQPIRTLLRMLFEREDHEVVEAQNGNDGLSLYREHPADLVITDLIMPEKEGIETIMDLRREFPDAKIIAISGGGDIGVANDYLPIAKAMGVERIFSKPLGLTEMLDAVREVLGDR